MRTSPRPLTFLVLDDNADGRFLLAKTLLRCFPTSAVQECVEIEVATTLCRTQPPHAVIAHRARGLDGMETIRQLREANPSVPIVYLSGIDRTQEAIRAGATCFLNYDAWLRIGTVVADLLPNHIAPEEGTVPLPDRLVSATNEFRNGRELA
ncbi:MAG TPA: response regulator [Opitutaceae bacterium]|nr:response regulator [Opitutaceae bacterium]